MKIVIINQHYHDVLGGSEIQCDIIARKLLYSGYNVIYLACNKINDYDPPYIVKTGSFNPNEIAKLTINERPDIVYWRYNKNYFLDTVRQIRREGIPVVFATSHINDVRRWRGIKNIKFNKRKILNDLKINIVTNWESWLNYFGFRWVDGVVVNNEDHLKKVRKDPKIYIPNSYITDKIEFNWSRPYICWIANIKKRKRPELCLEVAKKLSEKNIDILMIGKIHEEHYKWIKNSDELPNNLFYLGAKSLEEVNGIISSSLFLIHTCKPEGFPGNFIQSWYFGKPVVSFEFDPGKLIKDKKLGYVSENNLNKFTEDIQKLIDDNLLRIQIGENAKKFANEHFNPNANFKKLENFLLEVVKNSK